MAKLSTISSTKKLKIRSTHLRATLLEHSEMFLMHKISEASGGLVKSQLVRGMFNQAAFDEIWALIQNIIVNASDTIPMNWSKGTDNQIGDTLAALGRGDISPNEAKDLIGAISSGSDTVELKQLVLMMEELSGKG